MRDPVLLPVDLRVMTRIAGATGAALPGAALPGGIVALLPGRTYRVVSAAPDAVDPDLVRVELVQLDG